MVNLNRSSFGICLLSRTPEKLKTMVLYKEYFGLFCGARHRLFHADDIAKEDLEGEPFVAFQTEAEGGPLEAISLLRSRLNLSRNWRGVSSSLNEIWRLIMANVGIGALPLHVAQQDVAAGRIRQLPPYDDLPQVSIYLISNPARRYSEAEMAFLSMIETEISKYGIAERTYANQYPRG